MHDQIATAIIAAFPDVTFTVWVDPKYGYHGEMVRYAPELGRHDTECNSDGTPVISDTIVKRILADETLGDSAKIAGLRDALGLAWEERFAAFREE